MADWSDLSKLLTIIMPTLTAVGTAVYAMARWWANRLEQREAAGREHEGDQSQAAREHEKALAATMDAMSRRHEDATSAARKEHSELFGVVLALHAKTIETVEGLRSVVRENTTAIARNTEAIDHLSGRVDRLDPPKP